LSPHTHRRRGFNAVEMIVALVLVAVFTACVLLAIPPSREKARRAGCQANLAQVGIALALYHQAESRYPTATLGGPSPLAAMLGALGQPDFATFRDPKVAPPPRLKAPLAPHRIVGLLCPTDRHALASTGPAPTSYRADAGDTPDGQGGPFALGASTTLAQVEAADGAAYTAAFTERLVGDGTDGVQGPRSYAVVPGPIPAAGCPAAPDSTHRGDAGSSWARADWRSTLYVHAPMPDAPACIADDGRTAWLGASSEHPEGVHVLLLDGSVRAYRRSVSPRVWPALGSIGEPAP
jgi:prepilin-type N-terminal cleavage/methylation domain-containing protein